MKLTDYAKEQGGTATASCPVLALVAKKAECSAGTLYQISLGHKPPSWRLASRIESATRGQVTRHDLRPDVFGAPAANDDSASRKSKRKRAA